MGKTMGWVSALALSVLLCACTAKAQSTTYSYFYIAGQTSYTAAPGATVNVPIYLEEVNSDGSSNSFLSNEAGLYAGAFRLSLASSSSGNAATVTGVTANYSLSGAPASFDVVNDQSYTTSSAAVQELLGSDATGVAATSQGNGVSTVYLGLLAVEASATPGDTSTFTVGVYDPNNGNTLTFNNNFDLDNNQDTGNFEGVDPSAPLLYYSAASTDFDITSTPEPSAASVFAVALVLTLARRRRCDSGLRDANFRISS